MLPDGSPWFGYAFETAISTVTLDLIPLGGPIYMLAVYNCAAHNLLSWVPDQNGSTFFTALRDTWDLNGFVPGVLASESDQNTASSLTNPDFMKNFMLSDLNYLKTPYGRQYLAFAQRAAVSWGLA